MNDVSFTIIASGIVCGMQFVHSRDVIRRDLKPENILLDSNGFAEIADLGSGRFTDIDVTLTK
jgi:serine/threonine protein kinase